MAHRVFVTKRLYPQAIDYLTQHVEVDYHDSPVSPPPDELLMRSGLADGVVCQLTDSFSREVIAALPGVKALCNVAVGYDNIDVPAAAEHGVVVTNTPGVLTETTADFAFSLLMATARRVAEAERFLRAGEWGEWRIDLMCGQDIFGSTLGLVGMGRIGQAVARRARGFGMRVLYHDAFRASEAVESELGVEFASLNDLLAQSDFVSVHVPLLDSTHGMMGAEQFGRMKPTAILINTSRGPVVDPEALAEALIEGEIGGAGIDVFVHEPTPHPRLLRAPNALLTPHIASASVATRTEMCMMAARNVVAVLHGESPPNAVSA